MNCVVQLGPSPFLPTSRPDLQLDCKSVGRVQINIEQDKKKLEIDWTRTETPLMNDHFKGHMQNEPKLEIDIMTL